MVTKDWIEIGMLALMAGGLGGLIMNRLKLGKGIGVRAIQFLAVAFLLPSIVILALEDKMEAPLLGTLFGTVTGYVLSGISKEDSAD